jgi:hypothetical protein
MGETFVLGGLIAVAVSLVVGDFYLLRTRAGYATRHRVAKPRPERVRRTEVSEALEAVGQLAIREAKAQPEFEWCAVVGKFLMAAARFVIGVTLVLGAVFLSLYMFVAIIHYLWRIT